VSERVLARHRASNRATTPLTTLGNGLGLAFGGRAEAFGRSGAVIAVSSGLVATMGLPAQAMPRPVSDTGFQTASLPLVPITDGLAPAAGSAQQVLTLAEPVTAEPASAHDSLVLNPDVQGWARQPLTAPSTARLSFDAGSVTVPGSRSAGTGSAHAGAGHTSRAVNRAATSATSSSSKSSTGSPASKASPSKAATGKASSAQPVAARASGSAVLAIAARYVGIAYRYGGTTPAGFDCSGFVQYVYRQLGVSVPRTTYTQLAATTRIARSQARPGDLVFFLSGGSPYHVGIYAGGDLMYDSPRTGESISLRSIWSSNVVFTRV
jgi:peptidoglycan DL-endopeptidase CwlO